MLVVHGLPQSRRSILAMIRSGVLIFGTLYVPIAVFVSGHITAHMAVVVAGVRANETISVIATGLVDATSVPRCPTKIVIITVSIFFQKKVPSRYLSVLLSHREIAEGTYDQLSLYQSL